MDINKTLAEEFKLRQEQIDNTVALLMTIKLYRLLHDTEKSLQARWTIRCLERSLTGSLT